MAYTSVSREVDVGGKVSAGCLSLQENARTPASAGAVHGMDYPANLQVAASSIPPIPSLEDHLLSMVYHPGNAGLAVHMGFQTTALADLLALRGIRAR